MPVNMFELNPERDKVLKQEKFARDYRQIEKYHDEIDKGRNATEAYREFTSLVTKLKKSADTLRGDEVVDQNKADVWKSAIVDVINPYGPMVYAVGIAGKGVDFTESGYPLQITSMAAQQVTIFNHLFPVFSDTSIVSALCCTPGMFSAGTFYINSNFVTNYPITLPAGADLVSVVSIINSQSASTGVKANAVKNHDPDIPLSFQPASSGYYLKLMSQKSGAMYAFTLVDNASVLVSGGYVTTAPADSVFVFDGQNRSYPNNTVIDIVQGVTIEFRYPTTGLASPQMVTVSPDGNAIYDAVANFLNDVDAILYFKSKETRIDPATRKLADGASLGNEPLLIYSVNEIKNILSRAVYGVDASTGPNSLSTIDGISTANAPGDPSKGLYPTNGVFYIDKQKFLGSLVKFDAVKKVFASEWTATPPNAILGQHNATYTFPGNTFGMVINAGTPISAQLAYGDGSGGLIYDNSTLLSSQAVVTSGKFEGLAGTPFYGMTFSWLGAAPDSLYFNFTQGIADIVYNYCNLLFKERDAWVFDRLDLSSKANIPESQIPGVVIAKQNEMAQAMASLASLEARLEVKEEQYDRQLSEASADGQKYQLESDMIKAYMDAQKQGN